MLVPIRTGPSRSDRSRPARPRRGARRSGTPVDHALPPPARRVLRRRSPPSLFDGASSPGEAASGVRAVDGAGVRRVGRGAARPRVARRQLPGHACGTVTAAGTCSIFVSRMPPSSDRSRPSARCALPPYTGSAPGPRRPPAPRRADGRPDSWSPAPRSASRAPSSCCSRWWDCRSPCASARSPVPNLVGEERGSGGCDPRATRSPGTGRAAGDDRSADSPPAMWRIRIRPPG